MEELHHDIEEEDKKDHPKYISITYGIALGLLGILTHTILYVNGSHINTESSLSKYLSFINILATIALVIVAIIMTKKDRGGYIGYGKTLVVGLTTGVISGVVIGLYYFIFTQYVDTNYISVIIENRREILQNNPNIPQEQVDETIRQSIEAGALPTIIGPVFGNFFWGFIIALISGIFLYKKKPKFTTPKPTKSILNNPD